MTGEVAFFFEFGKAQFAFPSFYGDGFRWSPSIDDAQKVLDDFSLHIYILEFFIYKALLIGYELKKSENIKNSWCV